MRISGRNLNKKAEDSNRPAQFPVYEQPYYQTNDYPPPVIRRSGLSVGMIVLIAILAVPVLLIVIGIAGAIAVPSLLESRKSANEASAMSRLRSLHSAQATYQSTAGAGRFGSFDELVKANLVSENYRDFGYEYKLTRSAANDRYCISANILNPDSVQTKGRSFAISTEGVLYWSETSAIVCENGRLDERNIKPL